MAEMAKRERSLAEHLRKTHGMSSDIKQRRGDCPVLVVDGFPFEIAADPVHDKYDVWTGAPGASDMSDVTPMRFGLTRDQLVKLLRVEQ